MQDTVAGAATSLVALEGPRRAHPDTDGRDRKALLLVGAISATCAISLPGSATAFTVFSALVVFMLPLIFNAASRPIALPLVLSLAATLGLAMSRLAAGLPAIGGTTNLAIGLTVYLIGFAILTRFRQSWSIAALVGLCAATVVTGLIAPAELATGGFDQLWKYALGPAISILALFVIAAFRLPAFVGITVICALATVSFAANYRSHGALMLAAAVVLLFGKSQLVPTRRGPRLWSALAAVITLAVVIPVAAERGVFGDDIRIKTAEQTQGGANLLLGGRTEVPLSLMAISEKPWLGWGDLSLIDQDVISKAAGLADAIGLRRAQYLPAWVRTDGSVSVHSMEFSLWVEGGLLAAGFGLWLIYSCARAMIDASGRWSGVVTVASLQTIWDLLFSPFSRFGLPFLAVVAVLTLSVSEHERARSRT